MGIRSLVLRFSLSLSLSLYLWNDFLHSERNSLAIALRLCRLVYPSVITPTLRGSLDRPELPSCLPFALVNDESKQARVKASPLLASREQCSRGVAQQTPSNRAI